MYWFACRRHDCGGSKGVRLSRWWLFGVVAVAAVAFAACAPKSVVVLVPDPGGTTGRISVSNAAGSVEIDRPNAFTSLGKAGSAPSAAATMDEATIRRVFGRALDVEPPAPLHIVLYFEFGSTELQPDSVARLADAVSAIRSRGADQVSVVGHSDTAGDAAQNLELSLRRAEAVKARLVGMGIAEASIDVTSHGEQNPIVQTGDNVKEEKNRRVEIVVR